MADFNKIVDKTFSFEGGFQAFPNDSANWYPNPQTGELIGTNKGISAVAYGTYLGRKPTVAEMKAITTDTAKSVYKKLFWDKPVKGDSIKNQSVAHMIFDFIIASGQSRMSDIKAIANATKGSKVINETDSTFTDNEIAIINSLDQQKFHANLKAYRLAFIDRIIKNDPRDEKFRKGWTNRLNALVYVSESDAEKKS